MVPCSRSRTTAAPARMMASMVTLLMMPITLVNQPVVTFGLNHGRGIDQKLDRWVPARPNIALEIGGDVENKGKAAEVHQPVDIALLDGDGRFEVGRQESAHDLPRQGGMVLVHHRNRSITKFLAVALRLAHDGKGKLIDDEAQEHVIVQEASKLLEAQPENIGQRVHELTICSRFLLA